jgi:hypothetical protein
MSIRDIVDIASVIAALAAAGGLFLVACQTRGAEKARQLQATLAIFDNLGSDEQRALRRFVYNELPEIPTDFSDETVMKLEKVCDAFQRAGLLFNRGLVSKDVLLHYYGETTVRCWDKLQPYVEHARPQRGDRFLIDFERLAKAAKEYWNTPSGGRRLR